MKHLAGLIVVATLLIAGGVLAVLFGAFMLFEFAHQSGLANPGEAPAVNAVVNIVSVATLLVPVTAGLWSIFAGAGLLRSRKWARTSTLVIAAITLAVSSLMLVISLAAPFLSMNEPGRFDALFFLKSVRIFAIPVAICVWVVWYLNSAEVRARFGSTQTRVFTPIPPPSIRKISVRPVGVAVIAWYLITCGGIFALCIPAYLHFRLPSILFGFIVHRAFGIVVSTLWAGTSVVSGLALLQAKQWGRHLAIGVFSAGLASMVVTMLRPGIQNVMQQFLEEMYQSLGMKLPPQIFPMGAMMWLSLIFGAPIPIAAIVYLVRQKQLRREGIEAPAV